MEAVHHRDAGLARARACASKWLKLTNEEKRELLGT